MTWRAIWTVASEELVRTLRPPADSWHEFANSTATAEAIEQDFAHGEIPHSAELAAAIGAWTIDGVWPELSDGARHCLRLRLNASATFVYLLLDAPRQTPYLAPPPGQTEREILRWLLTAWWERHGRCFLARQISERHMEPDES